MLIKSEQEYERAQEERADLEGELDRLLSQRLDSSEGAQRVEDLRSRLEKLKRELDEYRSLKDGLQRGRDLSFEVVGLADIGRTITKARIAKGLSQADLAQRLGMSQQQVQRYESDDWRKMATWRLRDVIDALDISVNIDVRIPAEPYTRLVDPVVLGEQMVERRGMWQMRLLDVRKLSRFCKDRGLVVDAFGKDIERLWQLALLHADLVESSERLEIEGLQLIGGTADDGYLYADARRASLPADGWIGAGSDTARLPRNIRLLFHPFRYFVVYRLVELLRPNIAPTATLNVAGQDAYKGIVGRSLEQFEEYANSPAFINDVDEWNDVTALAVMTEPATFQRVFAKLRAGFEYSDLGFEASDIAELDAEDRTDLLMGYVSQQIAEHREKLNVLYKRIGVERIEAIRRDFCINGERLDPNKNVQTMLRLAKGQPRLELKGNLGGALYLRTMAEMLRRQAEDAFGTRLPEEDELGFGIPRRGFKKENYGAARLLDGDRRASVEFMRQFGLDYGLRLRWYVEGDTEYGALKYVFGEYGVAGVGVVNLRGRASKRGKVAAFRSSLREDLDAGVFSLVSIDADRADTVRAVRRAAEDDEICGQVFVSEPDFEFHNFTRSELEEVICGMIEDDKGAEVPLEDRLRLRRSLRKARNGDGLFEQAREALPEHSDVLKKGEEWGRHLMKYAWEYPLWYAKDSSAGNGKGKADRPIIDAVYFALTARRSNYLLTREEYRIDADSWELVER